MRVVFVVSQVTIKASLITCGEAYPVLRLNDLPCGSRTSPTGELEGEFHNCGYGYFALYILATIPRDNFAMSHICNTIKYHWCARPFFNCTLFIWKYFTRNAVRKPLPVCRKKWYRQSRYHALFRCDKKMTQKKDITYIHYITYTWIRKSWFSFFLFFFLLNYYFFPSTCR